MVCGGIRKTNSNDLRHIDENHVIQIDIKDLILRFNRDQRFNLRR